MVTEARPLELHLGVWSPSGGYECRRREFQVYLSSRCMVAWRSGTLRRATWKLDVASFFSHLQRSFRPRSISEQESDSEFDRGSSPGPRDAPSPPLASSGGEAQPTPGQPPRGQNTAQPWPAARWTEHSLPLVGGGVPGPLQSHALHRLVAEDTVVVDAAHFPHTEAQQRQEAAGALGGAPRGQEPGDRCSKGFPSRRSRNRAACRGVPRLDLKGPSRIPDLQTVCTGLS